ncbi:MAG: PEP-CTERM sorting domain-containing protein [Armatimonadetes bacterium]|nr:PEP-CTERM sorting domain-containing protein [Armatimonadota bacterium]
MRKTIAMVVGALVAVSVQAQTIIYDVITGATTAGFTTQAGNNLAGDNYLPPAAGAGNFWRITEISFIVVFTNAGNHSITDVGVDFYNQVDTVAGTPALSSHAGGFNGSTGSIMTSGANEALSLTFGGFTLDLAPAAGNSNGYGVQLSMNSFTGPGLATFVYVDNPSTVGSWSNGFLLDLDNDGVLEGDEFANFSGWTNGNLALSMTASAVPEPASMIALGIGAAALMARRRRRK